MSGDRDDLSEVSSIVDNDVSGHKLAQYLMGKNGGVKIDRIFGHQERRISVRVDLMKATNKENVRERSENNNSTEKATEKQSQNRNENKGNKVPLSSGAQRTESVDVVGNTQINSVRTNPTTLPLSPKSNYPKVSTSCSDRLRRLSLKRLSRNGGRQTLPGELNDTETGISFSQFEPHVQNLPGCTSTPLTEATQKTMAPVSAKLDQKSPNKRMSKKPLVQSDEQLEEVTVKDTGVTYESRARINTDHNAISIILTDDESENDKSVHDHQVTLQTSNVDHTKAVPTSVFSHSINTRLNKANRIRKSKRFESSEMGDDEDTSSQSTFFHSLDLKKKAQTIIFNDTIRSEQVELGSAGTIKTVATSLLKKAVHTMAEATTMELSSVSRRISNVAHGMRSPDNQPENPKSLNMKETYQNVLIDEACTENQNETLQHSEKPNKLEAKVKNVQPSKRRGRLRSKRSKLTQTSSSSDESLNREQTRASTRNSLQRSRRGASEQKAMDQQPHISSNRSLRSRSRHKRSRSKILPTSQQSFEQESTEGHQQNAAQEPLPLHVLSNIERSSDSDSENEIQPTCKTTNVKSIPNRLHTQTSSSSSEEQTLVREQTPNVTKKASIRNERVSSEETSNREFSEKSQFNRSQALQTSRVQSPTTQQQSETVISTRAAYRSPSLPNRTSASEDTFDKEPNEEQITMQESPKRKNVKSSEELDRSRAKTRILKKTYTRKRTQSSAKDQITTREPSPSTDCTQTSSPPKQKTVSRQKSRSPTLLRRRVNSERESAEELSNILLNAQRGRQRFKSISKRNALKRKQSRSSSNEAISESSSASSSSHALSPVEEESEILILRRTSTPLKKSLLKTKNKPTGNKEHNVERLQSPVQSRTATYEQTPAKNAPLSQVFPRQKTPSPSPTSQHSATTQKSSSPKTLPNDVRKKGGSRGKKAKNSFLEKSPIKSRNHFKSKQTTAEDSTCSYRRSQRERKPTKIEPYAIEIYTRAYFPEKFKKKTSESENNQTKNKQRTQDHAPENLELPGKSLNDNNSSKNKTNEPLQTEKGLVSWLQSTTANTAAGSLCDTNVPQYDGHFLSRELLQFQNHKDIEFRFYDQQSDNQMLGYIILKPKAIKKMVVLKHSGMKFICMSGHFKFKIKSRNSVDIKEYCATIGDAFVINIGDKYGIENLHETENGHIMMIKEQQVDN